MRLAADGARAVFATYLGGPALDQLGWLDLDPQGDIWVTGASTISVRDGQRGFLAHLSGDGTYYLGNVIPLPEPVSALKVEPDGDVALLTQTQLTTAPTTPDATLRSACSSGNSLPKYLQVRRPDGTLRFASYLMPADGRSLDVLARDFGGATPEHPDLTAPRLVCATGSANRLNTGRVAPGQFVTLVGTGLGPTQGVAGAPGPDGRFPAALGGVRVLTNGVPLRLLHVDAWQINAIVPSGAMPGTALTLAVEYQGKQTSAVTVDLIPAAVELFSLDSSGRDRAVALNQSGTLNSPENQRGPVKSWCSTPPAPARCRRRAKTVASRPWVQWKRSRVRAAECR